MLCCRRFLLDIFSLSLSLAMTSSSLEGQKRSWESLSSSVIRWCLLQRVLSGQMHTWQRSIRTSAVENASSTLEVGSWGMFGKLVSSIRETNELLRFCFAHWDLQSFWLFHLTITLNSGFFFFCLINSNVSISNRNYWHPSFTIINICTYSWVQKSEPEI